jgi:hypothetical protein
MKGTDKTAMAGPVRPRADPPQDAFRENDRYLSAFGSTMPAVDAG